MSKHGGLSTPLLKYGSIVARHFHISPGRDRLGCLAAVGKYRMWRIAEGQLVRVSPAEGRMTSDGNGADSQSQSQ